MSIVVRKIIIYNPSIETMMDDYQRGMRDTDGQSNFFWDEVRFWFPLI